LGGGHLIVRGKGSCTRMGSKKTGQKKKPYFEPKKLLYGGRSNYEGRKKRGTLPTQEGPREYSLKED